MTAKQATPYGSWPTPITTSLVLSSAISLSEVSATPSSLVWVESRPEQAGRSALVYRGESGELEEVTPDHKWNVRTRVHEYGGGSYARLGEDVVFSSVEGPAYKVSRKEGGGWSEPKQVTPGACGCSDPPTPPLTHLAPPPSAESDVLRFADFSAHPTAPSLLLTIVEDHTEDTPSTVVNTLALLDVSAAEPKLHPIASGADFYASARWSPSGKYLSWIQWNHPDMPWEGSELWVAEVNRGEGGEIVVEQAVVKGSGKHVAGKKGDVESVSQARWAKEEDTLVFLSDRTGFYELFKYSAGGEVELVLSEPTGADVGRESLPLRRYPAAQMLTPNRPQRRTGSSARALTLLSTPRLGSRRPRVVLFVSSTSPPRLRPSFPLPTPASPTCESSRRPSSPLSPPLPTLPLSSPS